VSLALAPCAVVALAGSALLAGEARACPPRTGVVADRAEPATAAALRAAIERRGMDARGATWIGKLPANGGGRRDTIIHVPRDLDPARAIELVVFMDGHRSFAAPTMGARHAAAIAAIAASGANAVYVAPDAPTSVFTARTGTPRYWRAGCARRRCRGGRAAPGDFVALVRAVRAHVGRVTCADAASAPWHLVLVGFSAGGRGVHDAVAQLAADRRARRAVALTRVAFADAVYAAAWLTGLWSRRHRFPGLAEVTVLLQAGDFAGDDGLPGAGNRWRAWTVASRIAGGDLPRDPAGDLVVGRLRLRRLPLDHHALGDLAAATYASGSTWRRVGAGTAVTASGSAGTASPEASSSSKPASRISWWSAAGVAPPVVR
jgi:hypothetical protein